MRQINGILSLGPQGRFRGVGAPENKGDGVMQTARRKEAAAGAALVRLTYEEGVRLDPEALVALYGEMGEAEAEQAICRATEDLAAGLAEIQRFVALGEPGAVPPLARRLATLGAQVGMTSLSRVAADLALVAGRGDGPAATAVLARLVRIGDRSLTAIWDLQDMGD